MSYEFKMPWPPSVNSWKTPYRNRMILTKKGRDYRKAVLNRCMELKIDGEFLEGRLSVAMVLNPPTLRKYDIDNFCKSLFDGLTHAGFWVDDEQVDFLVVAKGEKTKGGNIEIKVTKQEGEL